ncbi:hypothetical protein CWI42_120260 [Ordospora colligata]|uniref:Uncharacterized protein n=1 Tax=Ordospora colligata OC4 TaxID=1354746 RepID=A0A0B2UIE6_9MICR|nr:uncharacterized protein M896_120260 [Ordospora colligata OC4]KHN68807.1 hypothetical protein M896_120260 [Ordospora colligata OC4]TBU13841.1 hypothetical protein CWI40_120260 [Ordospora colligata]TBU14030.1 hypothetical protein CWI41_120260 [Ordospora colligata]TBU17699.1 hypothetical protein CWI42_120260 [Ordospora colligata]
MIEEEEEIIHIMEEIDCTFSSINRTLRKMKEVVERIEKENKLIINNLSPWQRFFCIESTEDVINEYADLPTHKDISESCADNTYVLDESSMSMKFSSPRNPFVDSASSETLNRTFLGNLEARFNWSNAENTSSSIVPVVEEREFEFQDESESSDAILPFNPSMLPPAFRTDEGIFMVYRYIAGCSGATIEDICRGVPMLGRERIQIFVDMLLRKRFIGKRGASFRTS